MDLARVQRDHEGWSASGPHFHVWQEDEVSARSWLEAFQSPAPARPEAGSAEAGAQAPTHGQACESSSLEVATEAFCFPP